MKLFKRILSWSLVALGAVAALAAGAGYVWLKASLPMTEGHQTVPGLTAETTITRDHDGLVFIRAANSDDGYFALGYAHAQDRMWQMEATRRLGAGRLAEIGGERFIGQDRIMRTLGIYRLAEASLQTLSPAIRAALDAYVRGVNAWLADHAHRAGPEFALFMFRPEPWRAADSMVWPRLMALMLSGNWRREIERGLLAARLAPGALERLTPPYPESAPVTVPAPGRARAQVPPDVGNEATRAAALAAVMPRLPAADTASNAWAVAGARTVSGKPVLANDPHLGFRAPNIWYLARLEIPGLTLAGATAPGVPFHVLGHNGRIAWGMTTTGADSQTVVRETLAPGQPDLYLTPDGPRPFATRKEIIKVRGGHDVTITVRESRNGPIVLTDKEGPLALRSAALRTDDATPAALYAINRARDWASFTTAIARFHSPVQNLVYADTAGHIGFSVAGRVPLRGSGDNGGVLDGRRADHDWQGFIPAAFLPRLHDPDSGRIVNANNRVVGPGYPHRISSYWETPYRAMRALSLLDTNKPHDAAASMHFQNDTLSLAAQELVPIFLRLTPPRASQAQIREWLTAWDGRAERKRPEMLIFTTWFAHLMSAVFADDLGPDYGRFARLRPILIKRVLATDNAWCDDRATPAQIETCPDMLGRAFDTALAELESRFGPDPAQWRWGAAHIARFRNDALDWVPALGRLSRVTIATDGDDFTLNRGTSTLRRGGAGPGSNPNTHVHGAVLRAVYDLADLDNARFAMPVGQSGHFLSPHYADLTRRWRDGDTLRLPARPQGALRILTLTPAQP